jgi:hypothetical protein
VKRAAVFAACLVVLAAAQAALRPKPAAGGGEQPAESAVSVLAGAARPLVVAVAWIEAEAALEDHRVLDALDRLRLLEAADPAGWEASAFRAHLIAHNLADREAPAARAARIVEAVKILEAASRRTADPGPEVARGQLLLEPRLWDAEVGGRVARALGASPRELAFLAFEEAARRAPGSEKVRRLEMEAARLAALEALGAGAEPAKVQPRLDLAAGIAAGIAEPTLASRLADAWAPAVKAAAQGSGEAIDRAGAALLAVLEDWGAASARSDDFEAVLAGVFARRALGIAEERLRAGDAGAALSLAGVVLKIRSFVSDRLLSSHLGLAREIAEKSRLLNLLDSIAVKDPGLEARVSALRTLVSAWR